jgi:Mn-containing catalase
MLLDIATEELSHLEMVGQTLVQLLKGSPGAEVDEVEGGYLGQLLDGKHEKFVELSLTSGPTILGGDGPRLTDSMGAPWTAAYRPRCCTGSANGCGSAARPSSPTSWRGGRSR